MHFSTNATGDLHDPGDPFVTALRNNGSRVELAGEFLPTSA
jgi:hypothetical protein